MIAFIITPTVSVVDSHLAHYVASFLIFRIYNLIPVFPILDSRLIMVRVFIKVQNSYVVALCNRVSLCKLKIMRKQLPYLHFISVFGVPEALIRWRYQPPIPPNAGCLSLAGHRKLNTTSYHPECDGMVERFNRTLKTMLLV